MAVGEFLYTFLHQDDADRAISALHHAARARRRTDAENTTAEAELSRLRAPRSLEGPRRARTSTTERERGRGPIYSVSSQSGNEERDAASRRGPDREEGTFSDVLSDCTTEASQETTAPAVLAELADHIQIATAADRRPAATPRTVESRSTSRRYDGRTERHLGRAGTTAGHPRQERPWPRPRRERESQDLPHRRVDTRRDRSPRDSRRPPRRRRRTPSPPRRRQPDVHIEQRGGSCDPTRRPTTTSATSTTSNRTGSHGILRTNRNSTAKGDTVASIAAGSSDRGGQSAARANHDDDQSDAVSIHPSADDFPDANRH